MKAEIMLDNAVNFMINSLFVGIGVLIVVAVILSVNRLFHKYWIPVDIFKEKQIEDERG